MLVYLYRWNKFWFYSKNPSWIKICIQFSSFTSKPQQICVNFLVIRKGLNKIWIFALALVNPKFCQNLSLEFGRRINVCVTLNKSQNELLTCTDINNRAKYIMFSQFASICLAGAFDDILTFKAWCELLITWWFLHIFWSVCYKPVKVKLRNFLN